jgi:fermentation-respiration switch protein FrsA (DUF1100 family)
MLIKIIAGALGFYLIYCGLLFFLQRQILFPRYQIPVLSEEIPEPAGIEKIWLNAASGKVEAWFMPPLLPQGSRSAPAVIFGHGNAELIDFWPQAFVPLTQLGIGVLLVEYPGYGRSAGAPSEKNIIDTFVKAYDLLVARKDVDPGRIILFGRSIGGGAVCGLAKIRPSVALILSSTFTGVRAFAVRFLVPGLLIRDPFDNLGAVKIYQGPTLIIHGKYDDIIPYSHGRALFKAASNPKMISYDCAHNDCPPDWGIFWKDIEAFLRDAKIL